jgi:hypothetical protein
LINLDIATVDQPIEEPQAFVATSTTYQEPDSIERIQTPSPESFDILDYQ